jgi:predicted glycosyltransferase
MKILHETDINPNRLGKHIQQLLLASKPSGSVQINLDGAENTARYLNEQMGNKN